MAEFHQVPADATTGQKLLNWVDNRFPLTKLWNDQWGKYYAPKLGGFVIYTIMIAVLIWRPQGLFSRPTAR